MLNNALSTKLQTYQLQVQPHSESVFHCFFPQAFIGTQGTIDPEVLSCPAHAQLGPLFDCARQLTDPLFHRQVLNLANLVIIQLNSLQISQGFEARL